jgi:hypothetical protein
VLSPLREIDFCDNRPARGEVAAATKPLPIHTAEIQAAKQSTAVFHL